MGIDISYLADYYRIIIGRSLQDYPLYLCAYPSWITPLFQRYLNIGNLVIAPPIDSPGMPYIYQSHCLVHLIKLNIIEA